MSDTPQAHAAPDRGAAQQDLRFLDDLLRRARKRIDPHAFHFVHWGAIVLVWYPLANALELGLFGERIWQVHLGIAAIVLGTLLSTVREMRLRRAPRVPDEDTHVTAQVQTIVFASICAGVILSCVAPAAGWIDGPDVPIIWGLVYANIGVMTGLVYRREFLYGGVFIFAAAVAAILLQRYSGFILGPAMGLGALVPGLCAERRVALENRSSSEARLGNV